MRNAAPLLLAALLTFSASAAAHITVTVAPLDQPLVVGVPTEVTVHFSEPCFEVLPQEAQGQDSVSSGLTPDAPTTFTWVGENVPFTTAMCDPTTVPLALVEADAKLTLTAEPDAPGLTNITLPVTSYLGGSTTPGETVNLIVQVAYFANATLKIGTPAGTGATRIVPVTLTYSANAQTNLTLAGSATSGTLTGLPAKTELVVPSTLNKTLLTKTFNATFASAGAASTLTVTATLAPKAGGPVKTFTTTLAVPAYNSTATGDGHDHTHSEEPKKTPLPLPVLVIGLGAALFVARRRLA